MFQDLAKQFIAKKKKNNKIINASMKASTFWLNNCSHTALNE